MTGYRLEIAQGKEGMFVVSAFRNEEDAAFANSGPIFHSEAEARDAIIEMFAVAWPAKDPVAVDPSIGV